MNKKEVIKLFSKIMYKCGENSICNFISDRPNSEKLFEVLENIEANPISKVQLDQLLCLHGLKTISDDFFRILLAFGAGESFLYN